LPAKEKDLHEWFFGTHTHICNISGIDGEDWRYIGIAKMAQEALYCVERSVTINLSVIFWQETKTFLLNKTLFTTLSKY